MQSYQLQFGTLTKFHWTVRLAFQIDVVFRAGIWGLSLTTTSPYVCKTYGLLADRVRLMLLGLVVYLKNYPIPPAQQLGLSFNTLLLMRDSTAFCLW